MFKIGVIGCGTVSQLAHLPVIERTKGLELTALCDPRFRLAQMVASRYGNPKVQADYKQLLADEQLDVVAVLAPSEMHAEITIAALQVGKHVIVEKPMAMTTADAQAMADAAEAAGKTLMVAYNHSYDPACQMVLKMLAAGDIGDVAHAEFFYRCDDAYGAWAAGAGRDLLDSGEPRPKPRPPSQQFQNQHVQWLYELVQDVGSHLINIQRLLLGDPIALTFTHMIARPQKALLSELISLQQYEGFTVLYHQERLPGQMFEKGFIIYGSKRWAQVNFAPPLQRHTPAKLWLYDVQRNVNEYPILPWHWGFAQEYEHLVHCLTTGEEPSTSGRRSVGDVALAERMIRAAQRLGQGG